MASRTSAFAAVLALASALALSACAGSSGQPGITGCLYNGLSQMIYPVPGATAVPESPPQIVFAVSRLFPSTWEVVVSNTSSASGPLAGTAAFTQIAANQVPSPSAALQISNPYYESATLSAPFSTGPHYVFLNDSVYSCIPAAAGSFTAL